MGSEGTLEQRRESSLCRVLDEEILRLDREHRPDGPVAVVLLCGGPHRSPDALVWGVLMNDACLGGHSYRISYRIIWFVPLCHPLSPSRIRLEAGRGVVTLPSRARLICPRPSSREAVVAALRG